MGDYVPLIQKGEGEKVVFLHGYLSCKESFYYQTEYFSKYYTVLAPDMPGFGQSAPLNFAWSVGDYAGWLLRFLKAKGAEGCIIIAHSFGARVAFKALSACPQAASKLVITGGAGVVKPRSKAYIRRVKRYRRVKRIFPGLAEKLFGSREYKTLSPVMRESYKKIVNEDLSGCARAVTCPTLLVYGKDDTVTPPCEEGEIFKNSIRSAVLKVIEGDHFCFCNHYEEFNRLVLEFLRES